jgi:hypothetical protein
MLYAGSLAFVPQKGAVDQRAMNQLVVDPEGRGLAAPLWPYGPANSLKSLADRPVVQVAFAEPSPSQGRSSSQELAHSFTENLKTLDAVALMHHVD